MSRKTSFVLLWVFLAASPVSAQQWARKMFKVSRHDFGSVARGAKVEFEFELSNLYVEDVHIASVRSSCGCTSPRIKISMLKTYQKGAIIAAFNTRAFSGHRAATLTVTFDKPFYAQVRLHVSGHIRTDVVFQPGSVQLGAVDQGTAADKRITVRHIGRSNWRIVDVKTANPYLSVKAVENRRYHGQVYYDLLVHLDESAPAGYFKDHLILKTNDWRPARIPLLVEGRVQPAVTVSPSSLSMGVVEPGKTVTKRLVVRGKKAFRILSIACDDNAFTFDFSPAGVPKTVHVIPVTFLAGEGSGKVSKTIRIETDLGEAAPELSAYAIVSP